MQPGQGGEALLRPSSAHQLRPHSGVDRGRDDPADQPIELGDRVAEAKRAGDLCQRKSAVLDHGSDEIVLHPASLAFADHWGLEPIAAMPGRGQTKGKSEAGVKCVKRNCLAGQRPPTLEAAQQQRNWWLSEVCNVRVHETTHRRPVDPLEGEREQLRPLAGGEFVYRPQLGRRVYLDFTVRWKDNFYEVPYQYAGRRVLCQEVGGQLSIMSTGQELARHDLLEEVGRTSHLPEHKDGLYRPSYPSICPISGRRS